MKAFINPPGRIPILLKVGILISKRITGKDLLIARLLAWYPKTAIGSSVLESLVAHHDKDISDRILKLVRMQASFAVSCPFCVDMNSFEFEKQGITVEELEALQGNRNLQEVASFSEREILAMKYAGMISGSPLSFPLEFIEKLKKYFSEREIVILAGTAAQVNYWARLIQALGVPPAGFSDQCSLQRPIQDTIRNEGNKQYE
ncbi:MAG: carboxymuconolactone decarboxylase family protein [Clostridiales bacterium]|nr:carboxymuconolactone decarboxylase family protein [Clostridiales bacterium]